MLRKPHGRRRAAASAWAAPHRRECSATVRCRRGRPAARERRSPSSPARRWRRAAGRRCARGRARRADLRCIRGLGARQSLPIAALVDDVVRRDGVVRRYVRQRNQARRLGGTHDPGLEVVDASPKPPVAGAGCDAADGLEGRRRLVGVLATGSRPPRRPGRSRAWRSLRVCSGAYRPAWPADFAARSASRGDLGRRGGRGLGVLFLVLAAAEELREQRDGVAGALLDLGLRHLRAEP